MLKNPIACRGILPLVEESQYKTDILWYNYNHLVQLTVYDALRNGIICCSKVNSVGQWWQHLAREPCRGRWHIIQVTPRAFFFGNDAVPQWLVRRTAERLCRDAVGSILTVGVCQLTADFPKMVAAAKCIVSFTGIRFAETCWGFKTVADASGTAERVTPS